MLVRALWLCLPCRRYAVGPELARFTSCWLLSEHRPLHVADAAGAFASAATALRTLAEYDPRAESLAALRLPPSHDVPMALDDYVDCGLLPPSDAGRSVTLRSVAEADAFILRCARYALHESRVPALAAFRDGFVGQRTVTSPRFGGGGGGGGGGDDLDVSVHLALFTPTELGHILGGVTTLSGPDLCRYIAWPSPKDAQAKWGSGGPPRAFREWLVAQEDALDLFRLVTARRAVPAAHTGGEPVRIELGPCVDDEGRLHGPAAYPKAATCFYTLKLPRYETIEQVARGMEMLLQQKALFTDA